MFQSYNVKPFFDEMLEASGKPKNHYQKFYEMLHTFTEEELKEKHDMAQLF
jgi:uncharacterized circularly permuted ATP-grasp superfamily protein